MVAATTEGIKLPIFFIRASIIQVQMNKEEFITVIESITPNELRTIKRSLDSERINYIVNGLVAGMAMTMIIITG